MRIGNRRLGTVLLVAMAARAAAAASDSAAEARASVEKPRAPVLDVPFVAQSEALCGGAAAAMVLRYWGERRVQAGDFAPLERGGAGIVAADLASALRARGWRAVSSSGDEIELRAQLQRGHPIVVLLREGGERFHYVVAAGAVGSHFLVHDPARGPYRIVSAADLESAWALSGHWMLLVLPGPERALADPDSAEASGSEAADDCAPLVDRGVQLARAGDLEAAGDLLAALLPICPASAAVARELAGVRFLQERWDEAARQAGLAVQRAPRDAYAWELLASSRYMDGDAAGALRAWNHAGAPRIDLVRIDGLERTRWKVVDRLLGLSNGTLLTEASLRRARRRLASLPSQDRSRLEYVPVEDGATQVRAWVAERARFVEGAPGIVAMAARAGSEREVELRSASPTGNGELWTASWRWWERRPRLRLQVELPAALGRAGVWRLHGSWERQAFRNAGAISTRWEERRGASAGFGQWATADWGWGASLGVDRWRGRGTYLSPRAGIEVRSHHDRVALQLRGSSAFAMDAAPFQLGSILARWRSAPFESRPSRWLWEARGGISAASIAAPLDVQPTAGDAHAASVLLRAHPLLDEGAIRTRGLCRRLSHVGLELQRWSAAMPVRFGFAAFVDAARSGAPAGRIARASEIDAGAGLRVLLPASDSELHLDAARGLRDGASAVSLWISTPRSSLVP